ncbi:MAG: hypothetical protein KDD44_01675 [Bdellovibrionales bacterium]|nr:hypothetical protein [Bdellovibrionales bacterium]
MTTRFLCVCVFLTTFCCALQTTLRAQSPVDLRIEGRADLEGWNKLHSFAEGQLRAIAEIPQPHSPELAAMGHRLERELRYATWGMLAITYRLTNRSVENEHQFNEALDQAHERVKRLYLRHGQLVEELTFLAEALSDGERSPESRASVEAVHQHVHASLIHFRGIHSDLITKLLASDLTEDDDAEPDPKERQTPDARRPVRESQEQIRKRLDSIKLVLEGFLEECAELEAAAEKRYAALEWRKKHPELAAEFAKRFPRTVPQSKKSPSADKESDEKVSDEAGK